jgi:general stress protein YciG
VTNTARNHHMQDTPTKDENPKSGPAHEAPPRPRSRRGFAAMDPESVRAIARLGGKAAHSRGTAHEFTSEEARAAGRKGGLAPHRPRVSSGKSSPPPPLEGEEGTSKAKTSDATSDDSAASSAPGGSRHDS